MAGLRTLKNLCYIRALRWKTHCFKQVG